MQQAYADYARMAANPGQPLVNEGRLRHKNGEWRFVESSCKFLPSGEILGNFRDITERKQIEDALRLAELRFRAMFDQPLLSVQVFATDGRVLQWNQAYAHLWDVATSEHFQQLQRYNVLADPALAPFGIIICLAVRNENCVQFWAQWA